MILFKILGKIIQNISYRIQKRALAYLDMKNICMKLKKYQKEIQE